MNFKQVLLITTITFLVIACSQPKNNLTDSQTIEQPPKTIILNFDDINNLPDCITEYIPSGHSALKLSICKINNDSIDDIILVLKQDIEETTEIIDEPIKRPLLILIGNDNQTFSLLSQNDNIVLCYHCGGIMGDPFASITTEKGSFTVEHYGGSNWRWTRDISFTYSENDNTCYLISDKSESYHTGNPTEIETEIKTQKDFGTVKFNDFNIYAE